MDQLLHDFGCFGENVICNYARQITRGIVFLHENDIIHRDLKGKGSSHQSTRVCVCVYRVIMICKLITRSVVASNFLLGML